MLGFESVLMQATTQSLSTELTAIITVVATLMASLGTFLGVILPKLKTNSVEAQKAKEFAIEVGKAATFAARGIIENKAQIQEGLEAGLNLSPEELRNYALKNESKIKAARIELELKKKQLDRLFQLVPAEANVDSEKDFPR